MKVERNIKEENLRNEKTNNIEEYTDENSVEIDFEEDLGFISGSEESTETPEEVIV